MFFSLCKWERFILQAKYAQVMKGKFDMFILKYASPKYQKSSYTKWSQCDKVTNCDSQNELKKNIFSEKIIESIEHWVNIWIGNSNRSQSTNIHYLDLLLITLILSIICHLLTYYIVYLVNVFIVSLPECKPWKCMSFLP